MEQHFYGESTCTRKLRYDHCCYCTPLMANLFAVVLKLYRPTRRLYTDCQLQFPKKTRDFFFFLQCEHPSNTYTILLLFPGTVVNSAVTDGQPRSNTIAFYRARDILCVCVCLFVHARTISVCARITDDWNEGNVIYGTDRDLCLGLIN